MDDLTTMMGDLSSSRGSTRALECDTDTQPYERLGGGSNEESPRYTACNKTIYYPTSSHLAVTTSLFSIALLERAESEEKIRAADIKCWCVETRRLSFRERTVPLNETREIVVITMSQ